MNTDEFLGEIGAYCREAGLAESTFGRLAVNDGKFMSRIRNGGRITMQTLDRVRDFIAEHPADGFPTRDLLLRGGVPRARIAVASMPADAAPRTVPPQDSKRNFRFFDNRQKYLLFVNTCSEKSVIGNRVSLELANIYPRPPAVRLFDAGMGDGSVLARVMRSMHARFPTMPFYAVGKEISLEDIRLTLDKLPDRLCEHPASVIVLTNLFYSEAPWLRVKSPAAANSMVWREVALTGNSAHGFEEQINDLRPFLAENWNVRISEKTGNPVYERPVVLVLYREDHRFLLDPIVPRPGTAIADFDLIIASQPYRLRASPEFKATRVVSPLARALGPGGRVIAIHSHGDDPGLEIVQRVWPDEDPYRCSRHDILKAVKEDLGTDKRDLNFNAYSDSRSIFRYDMHTLPSEVSGAIGTSTLFAAWNAAIYVAQIEDERLNDAVRDARYIEATAEVLHERGGLWFFDESFVISRRRK